MCTQTRVHAIHTKGEGGGCGVVQAQRSLHRSGIFNCSDLCEPCRSEWRELSVKWESKMYWRLLRFSPCLLDSCPVMDFSRSAMVTCANNHSFGELLCSVDSHDSSSASDSGNGDDKYVANYDDYQS